MTDNRNLSSLNYKLEWEDHLYELYGSFIRRNNKDEWIYFLRRPELAEKETAEEIASTVLKYITQYGNISLEILQAIEKVFHYSEQREKYETVVGYEAIEYYINRQLRNKEFPPYDLFGGYDEDFDYDEYIGFFNEIYYTPEVEDPEDQAARIKALKEMGAAHPYEALLESDFFLLCGSFNEAANALKQMPNGYHKYMALGNICAHVGEYENAELYLLEAVKLREHNLDAQVIGNLVMCKWHNNKQDEALDLIEGFIDAGYEHIVYPIKKQFLAEIAKVLMEKGKQTQLSEKEMLLIKDCYKIFEDYESVIKLSEISWEKGLSDESWTVDVIEAYFEAGEYDNAQRIIDMVLDGRRQISLRGQTKVREIRARLLFQQGRIKDAYEIMESLCGLPDSDIKQKHELAKMYIITGNAKGALKLLKELHYYQYNNIKLKYDMAVCYAKLDEVRKAAFLFRDVCSADTENKAAAMGFIQAIIDDDHELSLENSKALLERYKDLFSESERQFLQGQIFEMEDKCKEAQALYKSIIDNYEEGTSDFKLLNNALLRYFVMREENNGKVGEMEEEMLSLLAKYPDADELWVYLANFYEEADYKTERIPKCYQKALEANRFNSEARILLASIYLDNEETEKTLELYNEAILFTNDADVYMTRAYLLSDLGDYDQAKADIAMYEKLGGDKNEAIELNANFAMLNGEYEFALNAYEELNSINKGKKAPLYDDMAICMCKMGREDEAESLLDVACENSTNPLLYKILYDIQVHNGSFRDAKKTVKRYRKACDLGRLDEWVTLLNAFADLEAGKVNQALAVTNSMIESEGERLCGILEQLFGKHRAAVKLLKSALKNEPDELDNYSWLAFAHFLNGERQEAVMVAMDGLKLFEKTYGNTDKYLRCEPLCQYGFLKMMAGDMEAAHDALQKAADQPTCPEFICRRCYEAYAGLGIYHAIKGDMLQANQAFDESLKERPNNTICRRIRDIMA